MQTLPKKVRSKKLSTRVDLTAMVSVSFLLIIFFMVTIELAKPKVLEYGMSGCDDCGEYFGCRHIDENRILTILLDENDEIVTYSGLINFPIETPKKVNYSKNGIRKELISKSKIVLEYSKNLGKPKNGLIVIIKPSQKSNYGNLVNILNEMKILNIHNYSILNEFTSEEEKLLATR
ncbi:MULTISPECIES: biopolymer transporter ExbD [unclassified Flavobacterium]|uniref:ExbD/TolR family protein n=1 Tax=unclassified Flavobacterium TaxID=196869 RepID=UPI0012AA3FB4|nr:MULTISPECIES: biopolymer transporter ExbD [unclassified Flavobacterium]MBF4487057.1 biopolymer transporter ExbD [Flavobacterium sp. CSZ]QGK73899.1 biopolymer transporter ExbD [Flavobacterium sp. SLB02]